MPEYIVQVTGDDDQEWLVEVFATEEHLAGQAAITELTTRLADLEVAFPKAGTTILVVSGHDLNASPYEIAPATWGEWQQLHTCPLPLFSSPTDSTQEHHIMTAAVVVAGPCEVKVDTGSTHALEVLGKTRDGAQVRSQGYFVDVPGDDNGGEQGPPIDIQYMGEIAKVRLELTKYDEAVATKIRTRLYGGTEGTPGTAGTLMFSESKTFRVLLNTTAGPMNFPRCLLRDPWEVNKGTKYSTLVLEFEAHKDAAGVLYNSVTT